MVRSKSKKHKPTPEEIENDPSLRWFPYRRGELVWSDRHNEYVRFCHYVGDNDEGIALYDHSLKPLEGTEPRMSVRRPRAGEGTK